MKIETIITCVSETSLKMLKFTLPSNARFFDNIIIATSTTDKDTQNFCEENKINHITTGSFTKNNSKFNRGAVINECLNLLKYKDWVCHLDADILISDKDFKSLLINEVVDIEYMYSSRRVFIPNMNDILDILKGKVKEDDFWCPFGSGWGYFQLWNQNSQIIKSGAQYPESYDSSESDWKWRNLWGSTSGQNNEIYSGKLKELSCKVWHLGPPNIINGDSFWD